MGLEKQGENFWEREMIEPNEDEEKSCNKNKKYWEEKIDRRKALKRISKIGAVAAGLGLGVDKGIKIHNRIKRTAEEYVKTMKEKEGLIEWDETEELGDQIEINTNSEKIQKDLLEENNILDKTKEEEQIKQTQKEIIRLKEKKSEAEKLADLYLEIFHYLKNKKEFFPPEVFTRYLFIAQQLQESRYKHDAKSNKGAVGVMQNRPISIRDVGRYIFKLKRKNKINFSVPKELSDKEIKEIMPLLVRNPDYSRAFGKLYMIQLFDTRYGYGVAEEEWKQHNIQAVQKKILAAYNAGYRRIKYQPEWRWPQEARKYYKNIFRLMDLIKEVEKEIKKIEGFGRWPGGLIKKNAMNYALMKLTLEAAQAKWRWGQKQIIQRQLEKIKTVAKDKGAPLEENDLRELFKT